MNHPESFVSSYFERVLGYSTLMNHRFRGPAGRNWTDLDIVATPLPPLDPFGEQRPAQIIQVKWRAKFHLTEAHANWLDASVVNAPGVHEEVDRLLGGWKYEVVLVTTRGWLSKIGDPLDLEDRLGNGARSAASTRAGGNCVGVKIMTFEDMIDHWEEAEGRSLHGWAEDPFSFMLQVRGLKQVGAPDLSRYSFPEIAADEVETLLDFEPDAAEHREVGGRWLDVLLRCQGRLVLDRRHFRQGDWRGLSARMGGRVWVFFGRTGNDAAPVVSVWVGGVERTRIVLADEKTLRCAADAVAAALR